MKLALIISFDSSARQKRLSMQVIQCLRRSKEIYSFKAETKGKYGPVSYSTVQLNNRKNQKGKWNNNKSFKGSSNQNDNNGQPKQTTYQPVDSGSFYSRKGTTTLESMDDS